VYAEGLCRATVRQGSARVSGALMFEEVEGRAPPLPAEMPPVVREFLEWDAACRVSMEQQQQQQQLADGRDRKADGGGGKEGGKKPRGLIAEWLRSVNLPL